MARNFSVCFRVPDYGPGSCAGLREYWQRRHNAKTAKGTPADHPAMPRTGELLSELQNVGAVLLRSSKQRFESYEAHRSCPWPGSARPNALEDRACRRRPCSSPSQPQRGGQKKSLQRTLCSSSCRQSIPIHRWCASNHAPCIFAQPTA